MKRETLRHPKTYDLAARLGVNRAEALGYLTLLWDFAADFAPQGNIGKWPNGAIARACEWQGEPDKFIQSLIDSGWLDEHPDPQHRLVIHDVADHAEQWWKQKLTKLGVSFIESVTAAEATEPGSVRSTVTTAEATEPGSVNSTVAVASRDQSNPIQSNPNQTYPIQSPLGTTDLRKTFDGLDKRTKQAALAVAERIQTVVPMARGSPAVDWAIGVGLRVATGDLSRDRIERIVEAMRGKEIKRPQKYFMKALENGDA